MQFYLFNIYPKLHHLKWRKMYASHCSERSQLRQQPVDAVLPSSNLNLETLL